MSVVIDDDGLDEPIMVIEKATAEHPANCAEGDYRRWTILREALAELDQSKQHSFCKTCGHDIDFHEAIKEFKTKFAGRCLWKELSQMCHCEQYKPGPVMTAKEMQYQKSDNELPEK